MGKRINLINYRKKTGYQQEFIARKAGITARHYRTLEAGTSDGSLPVWRNLKELYQAKTIDELIEEE